MQTTTVMTKNSLRYPPRSAIAPSTGDVMATINAVIDTARDQSSVPEIGSAAMACVKYVA